MLLRNMRGNRWIAAFLQAVMLVPALGPMAMPCAALPQSMAMSMSQTAAMQCMRRPIAPTKASAAATDAAPHGMQCHHAMHSTSPTADERNSAARQLAEGTAEALSQAVPQNPNSSLRALDGDCCQNHCCCGATTSEWAQPAAQPLSFASPQSDRFQPAINDTLRSRDLSRTDSARAPPLT